jgi:hypothetical protein
MSQESRGGPGLSELDEGLSDALSADLTASGIDPERGHA